MEWEEWMEWTPALLSQHLPSQYTDVHSLRGSEQSSGSLPTLIFWGLRQMGAHTP